MRTRVKRAILLTIGIVLVIGVVLLVTVYHPYKVNAAARTEIEAWEKQWLVARDCILGTKPAASTPGESLAIRELEGAVDLTKCKPLTSRLSRGPTENSGIDDVEAAWPVVTAAATKFTTMFAIHLTEPKHDLKLSAAFDALETARGGLRAAAGLPPPAPLGPALQTAELVAIADAGQPVTKLEPFLPSAHGVVTFGATASGQVQVVITAGGAPAVARIAPGGIRSTADLAFGAAAGRDQILIGALDAQGAFAGEPQTIAMHGQVSVLLAGGTARAGVVVYGVDSMVIARRSDGAPAFAAEPPIDITNVLSATDPVTNRGAIAWTDRTGKLFGQIATAGATTVDLGTTGEPAAMCMTTERAYVLTSSALLSFRDTASPSELVEDAVLRGCSPNAAVLQLSGASDKFAVCTDTCRKLTLHDVPRTHVTVVFKGKLVALAARDGVIGVYREDRPPSYVAARITGIDAAITDGKLIDVIARTPEGVVIARIAAP